MRPSDTPPATTALPLLLAAPNPHYERLGGAPAVERLVAAFYRAMDSRPDAQVIRAMHDADLSHTRRVLVIYLTEWLGGPRAYTPARGAPMLRRRHQGFALDDAARDAWMACMRQALSEVCGDAALRDELAVAFFKVADFLRNTDTGGAPRAHPGRPQAPQGGPAAAAPASSPTRSVP